jgi:hypothetical protein
MGPRMGIMRHRPNLQYWIGRLGVVGETRCAPDQLKFSTGYGKLPITVWSKDELAFRTKSGIARRIALAVVSQEIAYAQS